MLVYDIMFMGIPNLLEGGCNMEHTYYIVELVKKRRGGGIAIELKKFNTKQEGEKYIKKYILERPANTAKVLLINRYKATFTSV